MKLREGKPPRNVAEKTVMPSEHRVTEFARPLRSFSERKARPDPGEHSPWRYMSLPVSPGDGPIRCENALR